MLLQFYLPGCTCARQLSSGLSIHMPVCIVCFSLVSFDKQDLHHHVTSCLNSVPRSAAKMHQSFTRSLGSVTWHGVQRQCAVPSSDKLFEGQHCYMQDTKPSAGCTGSRSPFLCCSCHDYVRRHAHWCHVSPLILALPLPSHVNSMHMPGAGHCVCRMHSIAAAWFVCCMWCM